jgi:hypothetical protein
VRPVRRQGLDLLTWDTFENPLGTPPLFTLSQNSGAINGQLAPIVRPDPCRP